MHILFLPRWYPDKYDTQNAVFIRKHAMAAAAHHAVFVLYIIGDTHLKKGVQIEVALDNGITEKYIYFKSLSGGSFSKAINSITYVILSICYTISYIRHKKPDVIHVHMLNRTGIAAWLCKVFFSIPYIITEHATYYTTGAFQQRPKWRKWITKFLLRHATCITAVSPTLRDVLQHIAPAGKYTILPNVVEAAQEEHINYSWETDKVHIFSVSDFYDAKKNVSGLLQGFFELHKQRTDFILHLVGNGPDNDKLRKMVEQQGECAKHIHFYGRLSNQEVMQMMQQIDFYVGFSNVETFSVTTAEALAAGKPVICTSCGGPEHFVLPENGIVIPKGDHAALVEALNMMMDTYTTYSSSELKAYIDQKYSKRAIAAQMDALYKLVIND